MMRKFIEFEEKLAGELQANKFEFKRNQNERIAHSLHNIDFVLVKPFSAYLEISMSNPSFRKSVYNDYALRSGNKETKHIIITNKEVDLGRNGVFSRDTIIFIIDDISSKENAKKITESINEIFILDKEIYKKEEIKFYDIFPPYNIEPRIFEIKIVNIGGEFKQEKTKKINDSTITSEQEKELEYQLRLQTFVQKLKQFIDPYHYKLIENETDQFQVEYYAKHFTSAALRIGRCLEVTIYILATTWKVDINKPRLERIHIFRESVNNLISNYEKMISSNDDNLQKNFINSSKDMFAKFTEITLGQDNVVKNQASVPLAAESIFTQIQRKFNNNSEYKDIREHLKIIEKDGLIKKIYQKRNRAAHTDIDLEKIQEFTEKEIDGLINDFISLIEQLAIGAELISDLRKKNKQI